MASERKCCVPSCGKQREDNVTLHKFPNPKKDPDRFRTWTFAVGGNVLVLDDTYVYNYRRVCHAHFEKQYWLGSKMLSNVAVPTMQLKGVVAKRNQGNVQNISDAAADASTSGAVAKRNRGNVQNMSYADASTSDTIDNNAQSRLNGSTHLDEILAKKRSRRSRGQKLVLYKYLGLSLRSSTVELKLCKLNATALQVTEEQNHLPVQPANAAFTLRSRKKSAFKETVKPLQNVINGLNVAKEKYARRLKDALNLSKNKTFQHTLKKFTTLAALFTVLQFREYRKGKMGRRFTDEEKIMGLTIYKRGPRCYRLLRKIFILPSPVTLSRMVSRAGLKPGINENIFQQLKRRARKMKPDDRLCTLIFDEMAISPHFDYNKKSDRIIGFVDNGTETKKNIADHVLVFMIRGVLKNYKQPISYTFCSGSTKQADLSMLIKSHISKVHSIGFKVLATICDQGASNVSAINHLIEERRIQYLKRDIETRRAVFEVDGEEIIPLYDVPHLLKGIRNNLLTKNLKFSLNGTENIAKWDHIIKLHENNPTYKGIRIIKKLTEDHCTPERIPKMKVKYATQIFSQTVGVNMGYLADEGKLPAECQQTADLIIFMDGLFDSMNGSYKSQKKGKPLLQALTPKSAHNQYWIDSKKILSTMRFVNKKDNSSFPVPSVKNWLRTIENMEYLRDVLFQKYDIKSIWCRHFNQDPLENFFGSVRSHGYRNNSPTCAGFEAAFASLLVNNLSSNYSAGSNCEQDSCYVFKSLKKMFFTKNEASTCEHNMSIDFNDVITDDMLVDINIKKGDPRIFAALEYVTGYILSRLKKKVFKNCKVCNENLYKKIKQPEGEGTASEKPSYIKLREYAKNRTSLNYPSDELVACFSEIQDIIHHILKEKSSVRGLKNYIKLILDTRLNMSFVKCERHKCDILDQMYNDICNFFICNWCRDVNKIICGRRTDVDKDDVVQVLAFNYCSKRKRK